MSAPHSACFFERESAITCAWDIVPGYDFHEVVLFLTFT